MNAFRFDPIGYVRSCFREKFGIPRQPGLVPEASATLEIVPPFDRAEAFRHLACFSHIWVIFVFHQCLREAWQTMVRPPRFGGNRRVGVFASRSGFRPNPIGQSAVSLVAVETGKTGVRLHLKGIDLLDGTPVLDIKPYVPYADSRPEAVGGYAPAPPAPERPVFFAPRAQATCRDLEAQAHPHLGRLIRDLLAQDPRPGYTRKSYGRIHGMRLWDINIRFRVEKDRVVVVAIEPLNAE